jgi:hypothetical protein
VIVQSIQTVYLSDNIPVGLATPSALYSSIVQLMSGKLPLLFVASTLLFSACTPDEVAPTPQRKASLEGRWVWQKAIITHYDADNQLISSTAQVAQPGASYLDIKDETLQRFHSDGTALTPP